MKIFSYTNDPIFCESCCIFAKYWAALDERAVMEVTVTKTSSKWQKFLLLLYNRQLQPL